MNSRFLLLAMALLVFGGLSATAQTYSVPRRLVMDKAVKREFPTWLKTPNGYEALVTEGFYPIGWSRDGKFAYVHEPVDEECGCYFANLVIRDTRSDKVLWEFKYDQDKLRDPKTDRMPPENNIQKLWRKNQRLFSRKLREYGIQPSRSVLIGKTLKTPKYIYEAGLDLKKNPDPDHTGDAFISDLTVSFWSNPWQGGKIIYSIVPGDKDYQNTLDAAVLGMIASPYGRRVAVVTMEIQRGWEGPPHTGNIQVIGADFNFGEP